MDGWNDVTRSKIAGVVGSVAPILGKALLGNAGGVLVSLLGNIFGSGSADSLAAAIANDPEAAIKLRTLENQHAEFLADIDKQNFGIETADRQDARKYAEANRPFLITMSFVVTAGFFGVLLMLFMPWNISEEGKNLLSMLVGMLASKWQTIIDFFFGSSHSLEKANLALRKS